MIVISRRLELCFFMAMEIDSFIFNAQTCLG